MEGRQRGPLDVSMVFGENIRTILKTMTVLCRLHAYIHTYILSDTLSLSGIPYFNYQTNRFALNSLGKGGQRIGQRGPPHFGYFFILIRKCVHRRELNKTDMKNPFI